MEDIDIENLFLSKDKGKELKQSDLSFVFNLTKGKIAETIVQELFLLEGYQVYKYGLENNYQGLYRQITRDTSAIAKSIKNSPDLLVFDPRTGVLNYLEVKFRSTHQCDTTDFEASYGTCFPNCVVMYITPRGIYAIPIEKLPKKSFNFKAMGEYKLIQQEYFSLNPKTVQRFEELVNDFFNDLLFSAGKKYQAE